MLQHRSFSSVLLPPTERHQYQSEVSVTLSVDVRRHEHGAVAGIDGDVVEVPAGRQQQAPRARRQRAVVGVHVQPARVVVRARRPVDAAAARRQSGGFCRVHYPLETLMTLEY